MSSDSFVDLHSHSSASDGSFTPTEVVSLAVKAKLSGIALTDHDTVSGLDEFMKAAKERGITGVPGVELSSQMYNKEVHLVGLFIDPENESFKAALKTLRDGREYRNIQVVEKLKQRGYEISYEEVLSEAQGESIGRPHIASVLVRKHYFPTMRDVFQLLLRRGASCYVQRQFLNPCAAIQAIHDAGGLAFWAHPLNALHIGRSFLRKFYKTMEPAGLDGLETYYTTYNPEQHSITTSFAKEMNLLESGGSDFHGKNQPGIEIGVGYGQLRIPAELLEKMFEKRGLK